MYFAKHESFYIRDGWLNKGLKAIDKDPDIFIAIDAPERLGLGKNMVRALRYWMQATGLAYEAKENRFSVQRLSPLGKMIFNFDPYFELEGTLWLIHHQLMSSSEFATTWYWFFNHFSPVNFTRGEFIERLGQWINTQGQNAEDEIIAEGSLRKDFDCLIHTYLADQQDQQKSPEDQIVSPLASLSILADFRERDEDDKKVHRYRLLPSNAITIPPLVFLHVLLSRQESDRHGALQVGMSTVLREPMNVGRTFNIGMMAFEELATHLEDHYPEWKILLTRTGGLDQLTLPKVTARQVLERFYVEQTIAEGNI